MSEASMRRVGLKLVFVVALTTLLVTSVRQQWNSAREKFTTREMSSNESDSGTDEEAEQPADSKTEEDPSIDSELANANADEEVQEVDALETEPKFNKVESVDTKPEVDAEVGNDQNDDAFTDEFRGDGELDIKNEEKASETNFNFSSTAEGDTYDNSPLLPDDNSPQTLEKESNVPAYDDDDDDNNPNWRASKFADALYNDEEDDENDYKESDLGLQLNGTNDNDDVNVENTTERPLTDQAGVDNTNNKESSVFSWLGLEKYLSFVGNSQKEEDTNADEVYKDTSVIPDDNPDDEIISNLQRTNASTRMATANESNMNGDVQGKDLGEYENVNEISSIDTSQNKEYNDEETQNEANIGHHQQIDNKNLPFDINGLDHPNYDDFDDAAENSYQTPKEEDPALEFKQENSLTDTAQDTSDNEVEGPTWSNIAGQKRLTGLRLLNRGSPNFNMGASQTNKPYGSYVLQGTQRYEQHIQPVLYEKQPNQVLPQLTERHQQLFKAFFPPHIADLILSGNFESSNLKQYPTKLQYYIHQNIHRIDQDFDPLANNMKASADDLQEHQLPAPQTVNEDTETQLIQPIESSQNEGIDNNINYEDVDNYDTDNANFEQDNYDTNDENNENGDVPRVQYTPSPDKDIYDNPRPLSEREFALFRTKAYNANNVLDDDVPQSPVEDIYNDYDPYESEAERSPLQPSNSRTELEDETMKCPREIGLTKKSSPVTALVGFPDASTAWVRKILEQLTGTETDNIYNIRAQLKAGNADGVFQMGRKIAIETHMATDKNFERAVVVIRNPFSVDEEHKTFRPSSIEWQKSVLWNQTYSTWLSSDLPMLVMTYEDLVERPLTQMMKVTDFLSNPEIKISYRCAMDVALKPPSVIDDITQITGIYQADRRRINQNIDFVIKVAEKKHPEIVRRLESYKVYSGS